MWLLNAFADTLLAPFRRLPPEAGLVAWGVLAGTAVLLLFKVSSSPGRVARARGRAVSRLLELWLYRHDPLVGLGSVARMAGDTMRYLACLLPAALCSLLPMMLLLAQGHDWFAARGLRPGEKMMVVARLRADAPPALLATARLEVSGPLRVASPPVRAAAWREVAWNVERTGADGTDGGRLLLRLGGQEFGMPAATGPGLARRPACRTASWREQWLFPGETPLPRNQPLARIALRRPAAEYNLLGWRTSWLWGLMAVSLLTGLLLKRPLGVEF
jgi:hypothetical protein